MPKTHHLLAYIAAGALALIVGLWAGRLTDHAPPQPPVELQNGTYLGHMHRRVANFALVDHTGTAFTPERLMGRWSLLFFGYTHCPDICPTTLTTLAETQRLLETDPLPEPVQVVFISVDPERDRPAALADYVRYFNPGFIGITGAREQIDALTSPLGILHAKVPDPANTENYLLDHSAQLLLINPQGEVDAVLSAPHTAPVIAADLRTLLQHAR